MSLVASLPRVSAGSTLEYNIDGTKTPAADHPPLYILFLGFWSWIGLPGPTAT